VSINIIGLYFKDATLKTFDDQIVVLSVRSRLMIA
jgi:hypothetical protein